MVQASAIRPPSQQAPSAKRWPEVRGRLLTGCLRQVQRDPFRLYHTAWRELGDYIRLRALPGYWYYLLADPAAIEYVLHTNQKNYRKPDMFNNSVSLLAGNGILSSEGDFWRRQRRLIQPAFLRNTVAGFAPRMIESIDEFIGEWERTVDGRTIDVVPEMMRLGLRIASRTLFSTDISGQADSIGRAYRTAFEYVSMKLNGRFLPPLWMPTPLNRRFRAAKALLDRVVLELIASRRNQPARGDVLDRLLAAQDEQSGVGMSDEQLKDEAITVLTAGHETAGTALSWAWYLLSTHPDQQQALAEQVRGHLQGRLPSITDLPSIPLATAVFEESMRLYPPAWGMPRETIAADDILGYPIPARATLVLSQMLVHRHPDFWDRPDAFEPARFLPGASRPRPKFAFFPFGGGPRICVGNHFAMIEGPLALAALAQRFEFTYVEGQEIVPDTTFTLRPKYGVRLAVRRRP